MCLFNNSEWIPVDWAEIKDDTARFEHMDWRNIVYLVGYYKEGRIIPAAPPILTTEMAKHTISARPNMQKKNKMRLERKYTEAPIIFLGICCLMGGFKVLTRLISKTRLICMSLPKGLQALILQ